VSINVAFAELGVVQPQPEVGSCTAAAGVALVDSERSGPLTVATLTVKNTSQYTPEP